MEHCFTPDPILNHIKYDANQNDFIRLVYIHSLLWFFIHSNWLKINCFDGKEIILAMKYSRYTQWLSPCLPKSNQNIWFLHFNKFPIAQIETMWAQAPTLWRIVTAPHYSLVITLNAYLYPPSITSISRQTLGLYHNIYNFSYFWTNLRPKSVELIFVHILRLQNSKARLFEFWTKIVIIGLTIFFFFWCWSS